MNATTTAPALAPEPAPARGWPGLPCLYCGEADCVKMHLSDLSFVCQECEAEFSLEEARDKVKAWLPLLAWLDLAPPAE